MLIFCVSFGWLSLFVYHLGDNGKNFVCENQDIFNLVFHNGIKRSL